LSLRTIGIMDKDAEYEKAKATLIHLLEAYVKVLKPSVERD
jgi:hypothetical protein